MNIQNLKTEYSTDFRIRQEIRKQIKKEKSL